MKLEQANNKTSQRKSLYWITIVIAAVLVLVAVLSYYLVFLYPENQVSQQGITNVTEKINFINQYRTTSIQLISTIAQIFGGIAVAIGIYIGWGNLKVALATLESNQNKAREDLKNAEKALIADQNKARDELKLAQDTLEANMKIAQENLKVAQEGQITERFTRAVDQLGNPTIEIRLGGIYGLERIANESEKDYWPIIKIFAAYIREKSPIKDASKETKDTDEKEKGTSLPTDIQVVFEYLCSCKYTFHKKLDLRNSNLRNARFFKAHLEYADFSGADLRGADLVNSFLNDAYFVKTNLNGAILINAHFEHSYFADSHLIKTHLGSVHLENACFTGCHLEDSNFGDAILNNVSFGEDNYLNRANLQRSSLVQAYLVGTNLEGADFEGANLWDADLERTNLKGARNLTVDQLSKARTLYHAELDPELEAELRANGFGHLLDDKPKR
jgi:hypothetical protein